ncbi:kinase-like domain-containing protein [Cubamyces lactineus]|nr:kinase-like domain-containing protein [Cubamyces lactineus]
MASNPPPWAYVDMRDDQTGNGTPRSQPPGDPAAATAPTTSSPTGSRSQASGSSSKPPSMTSPKELDFVKELGCGSWSTVMEAVQIATGKHYAVKILSKAQLIKQKKVKYANVEKDALAKLSGLHPGFIRMHAAFQDETSLYFVLDLAPNGDLADLVKKHGSLALPCARWYIAQMVDAVLWMHSKGVLHRDLKPENVLLDNELRVKISDFGSAYLAPDGDLSPRSSSFVGSAAYVSPELLNRSSKTTSKSSDLWAIGCTVYFVVAGMPAFAAINDYQSFRKIEALDYSFPEGFYDVAKDLVQQLLVLDPAERLGVEPKSSPTELREHAFFTASVNVGGSEASPVRWDTLWTDSPVAPETGIVPPSKHPADDEDVWESMVQEFSAVNLRSPVSSDRDPLSLSLSSGARSAAPVDVPPDVVPSEVVESVPSEKTEESSPRTGLHEKQRGDEELDDPALGARDWSQVLSNETLRRATLVKTQIRKGLLKQSRPCALLLTSRPRLLCVALDEKEDASPKSSDVKHSFSFPPAGVAASKSEKNEVVRCRREGKSTLAVQTASGKEYAYNFADPRIIDKWIEDVSILIRSP